MTVTMVQHDSIVISPMWLMSVCLQPSRATDHQVVPDGISFRPKIQRDSERSSRCIPNPRILSLLKTPILPLPDYVNWNLTITSSRTHSSNVKERQSSSLRDVLIR